MSDNNEMKSNECIRQPMEMINDNKVRNETVLQSLSKFSDVLSAQKNIIAEATATSRIVSEKLSSVTKPAIEFSLSPEFAQMAKKMAESMATYMPLINKANAIVLANTFDVSKIISPITEMLASFQKDYLLSLSESLKNIDLAGWLERLYESVFQDALEARWFPLPAWDSDPAFMDKFIDIIETTNHGAPRTKKIDSLIINYYTKTRLETIKKSWRADLPYYKYKMLHQAVQAYHRHEYALTLSMLSTMWEGIIYDKVNDSRRKKGPITKENYSKLVEDLKFKEFYETFFVDYIFYDCNSSEDVIEDVPGRHGVAHSFYQKYPSKKAALNAILFTEFLLKIQVKDVSSTEEQG